MRTYLKTLTLLVATCGFASVATLGCSDDAGFAIPGAKGKMQLRLTTVVNGATYRLVRGTWDIKSKNYVGIAVRGDDRPNETLQRELPVGDYTVELKPGWELRKEVPGKKPEVKAAVLVSDNPRAFSIKEDATTNLGYSFEVEGTMVEFPVGKLVVDIKVSEKNCDASTDRDQDGIPDCHDHCPDDPNKWKPLSCGCGFPELDENKNGVTDCLEKIDRCEDGTLDTDGDSVPDCQDNCPFVANFSQEDSDQDGVGDVCPRGTRRTIDTQQDHSCALRSGKVYCWGEGDEGQLGDNRAAAIQYLPVQAVGIEDAIAVTTGSKHSCALRKTGAVMCWGMGYKGQIGHGEYAPRQLVPARVKDIDDAVAIVAGAHHSCALRKTGEVMCWGEGRALGHGSRQDSNVPVLVRGLGKVVQISAGEHTTCAVEQDGATFCWGLDRGGLLARAQEKIQGQDQALHATLSPLRATALPKLKLLEIFAEHACGIKPGGQVLCWGDGEFGQLGPGDRSAAEGPVEISGLSNAVALSSGGGKASCALDSEGRIKCWGTGALGITPEGQGSWMSFKGAPVFVENIDRAREVTTGSSHGCAALSDGDFICWGDGKFGQLGYKYIGDRPNPGVPDLKVALPK